MPGIVGIITKRSRAWAENELSQMLKTMLHESFYTSGIWGDPSLGIYVGWVARRGSFAAEMPVQNERSDITLIFSGEEFPKPAPLRHCGAEGMSLPKRVLLI